MQLGEHGTDDVDEPDLSLKVPGLREVEAEVQVSTTDEGDIYRAAERFEDLGLSPELLQGIYQEMKFERPSKIQAKTLPMILRPPFRSMIAQAHNGSGKTTCFALAMLSRVDPKMRVPQALCMCPTRELVVQNVRVVAQMGKHTSIQIASTADTVGRRYDAISDQIVIGTHGTIKNWMGRNRILPVDGMRILVFDEADEMLARDGFGDDSMRLINDIRRCGRHRCAAQATPAGWSARVVSSAPRLLHACPPALRSCAGAYRTCRSCSSRPRSMRRSRRLPSRWLRAPTTSSFPVRSCRWT